MNHLLLFLIGLFIFVIGLRAFCTSRRKARDEAAEYCRYLDGKIQDPRD